MSFTPFVGTNFILMQNSTCSLTARQVTDYLTAVKIILMDQAVRSQPYRTSMGLPTRHNQLVDEVIEE